MKKSIWSVILAIAVYTAIVFLSDAKEVGNALSGISLYWIPLFLSLSLLNYLLRFFKWQYFLIRIGVHIPWKESLAVFVAGFSMTVSPGKLGELLKCFLLKDSRNIPVSRTSPVVVAEKSLRKGTILSPSDLTLAVKNLNEVSSPGLDLNSFSGKKLLRNIKAGTVITSPMIATLPLIKRGERVKIVISSGPLHLSATGIARTDGKRDQMIRVQNINSNKIIHCRVAAPGLVEVLL